MTSGNMVSTPPGMKSKIQSIASPGPAMNPSSDMLLFTTTLPVAVLASTTLHLRRTVAGRHPGCE